MGNPPNRSTRPPTGAEHLPYVVRVVVGGCSGERAWYRKVRPVARGDRPRASPMAYRELGLVRAGRSGVTWSGRSVRSSWRLGTWRRWWVSCWPCWVSGWLCFVVVACRGRSASGGRRHALRLGDQRIFLFPFFFSSSSSSSCLPVPGLGLVAVPSGTHPVGAWRSAQRTALDPIEPDSAAGWTGSTSAIVHGPVSSRACQVAIRSIDVGRSLG